MTDIGHIASILGLTMLCTLGVLMSAVRLPGTWLIVVGALVYAWWGEWQRVSVSTVLLLAGIALVAEAAEMLMSVLAARRAGGSRRAAWGGLFGGILGMFLLSIPIPVIGTVIGALLGCFAGALVAELSSGSDLARGTRVGYFSAMGFAFGSVAKMALAMVISSIILTSVICTPPPLQSGTGTQPTPAESHDS